MRSFPIFSCLCLLALGCSSDRDAIEKRLSSLREDITRVQSENDRLSERMEALETKQAAAANATQASEPAQATRIERPPLKIVKLVPGDAPVASADEPAAPEVSPEERPDAPGTRPVIRVRGRDARGEDGNSGISLARPSSAEETR